MKIKNIFSICLIATVVAITVSSCEQDDPMEKEQYIKQISLVGAQQSNEGHTVFDLSCKDDTYSQAYVSVAISGTLRPDQDVTVTLTDDVPGAIDEYNRIFLSPTEVQNRQLPESAYQIPNYNTIIKAGEAYARLPINIQTTSLECDSIYALPFRIKSVSKYDYRKVDTILIMALNLVNEYSHSYRWDAYRSTVHSDGTLTDSVPTGQLLNLKAVSEKSMRFLGEGVEDKKTNIANYGVTLTVKEDNTLSVAAWNSSKLTVKNGSGHYDPKLKTFYVQWNYIRDGVEYQVGGTMVSQKGQLQN